MEGVRYIFLNPGKNKDYYNTARKSCDVCFNKEHVFRVESLILSGRRPGSYLDFKFIFLHFFIVAV